MATNKKMTEKKPRTSKDDSSVVYKVMIALVLLCGALFALQSLCQYYATVGGFMVLYDLTPWIVAGGLAVALFSAVVLAVWHRKTAVQLLFPWILVLGLLAAATGFTMRTSWVDNFSLLYFLCAATLIQYIVFQLYRWEFFLVSLSTVTAGGLFFGYRSGFALNARSVILFVILMVVLLGTALCAFLASRNKGRLVFGKRSYAMFPSRFNPIFIYIADVLWFCCTIAVLFLGSLFSYYCMFGAIAVEFIAAIYYTFQLN